MPTLLRLYLGFALCGLSATLWLPALPMLQQRLSLSHAALGLSVGGRALAGLVAAVAYALWLRRGGRACPDAILAGCLAGLIAALGWCSSAATLVGVLLAIGVVLALLGANINLAATAAERRSIGAVLGRCNAVYGMGLAAGAALGGWLLERCGTVRPALLLNGLGVTALAIGLHQRRTPAHLPQPPQESENTAGPELQTPSPRAAPLATGTLLWLAAAAAIAESSIGAWGPAWWLKRAPAMPDGVGYPMTAFSLGLTLGRAQCDRWATRWAMPTVLRAGMLLAALATTAALLSPQAQPALLGLGLAGVGLAAVSPYVMRLVQQGRLPDSARARACWVVAAFHAGSFTGPWLSGIVVQHWGAGAALAVAGGTLAQSTLLLLVARRITSWRASSPDTRSGRCTSPSSPRCCHRCCCSDPASRSSAR
ncbi:MAG: MFS transporter [Polyangiales bacterium]